MNPDQMSLATMIDNNSRSEPCPSCGGRAAVIRADQVFYYGDGPERVALSAPVEVLHCADCNEQFAGYSAEEARHEAICSHLGRLSPKEIRDLRASFEMSQAHFAETLGIGVASLKRWETGALIQNASADRFLRLLRHRENMARLKVLDVLSRPILERAASSSIQPRFRKEPSLEEKKLSKLFQLHPPLLERDR